MDKSQKKHKAIFDEKLKVKPRLHSFYAFLDTSDDQEILEFLTEHRSPVFALLNAGYHRQYNKISAAMQDKRDKLLAFNSKHVLELLNIYGCIRKILLYCGRQNEWWTEETIEFIVSQISTLLRYKNDHRIRLEGFRLLVLCFVLDARWHTDTRFTKILLAAPILNPYKSYLATTKAGTTTNGIVSFEAVYALCDDNVILPSKSTQVTAEETGELFDTLLYSLIAVVNDAPSFFVLKPGYFSAEEKLHTLETMFSLIKIQFLHKLFPQYHHLAHGGQVLFQKCPPEFLRSMVSLQARYSMKVCDFPFAFDLNKFMFGSESASSYSLEILKSSMLESPEWPRVLRYSLQVIRLWLVLESDSVGCVPGLGEEFTEEQLLVFVLDLSRNYLKPRVVLDPCIPDQASIYCELLETLRTYMVIKGDSLSENGWMKLLEFLELAFVEINDFCKKSKSWHIVGDTITLLVETVIVAWIRSNLQKGQVWTNLKSLLSSESALSFTQTPLQWGKCMKELALVYSSIVFDIKLDSGDFMKVRNKSFIIHELRKSDKIVSTKSLLTRQLSESNSLDRPRHRDSSSTMGGALFSTGDSDSSEHKPADVFDAAKFFSVITLPKSLNNSHVFNDLTRQKFSQHPSNMRDIPLKERSLQYLNESYTKAQEFSYLTEGRTWTKDKVRFSYHNCLRILGDFNNIQNPHVHSEAFAALFNIVDALSLTRSLQSCFASDYPPIFESLEWLWQCFDKSDAYNESKCLGYNCLGRLLNNLMFNNFTMPRPPERLYQHTYMAILKGLQSRHMTIISSILQNFASVFSQSLPEANNLVSNMLLTLASIFNAPIKNGLEVPEYLQIKELSSIPEAEIKNSLRLLSSLIYPTFPGRELGADYPLLHVQDNMIQICGSLPANDVHELVISLILAIAPHICEDHSEETKCLLICAASAVVYKELASVSRYFTFNVQAFELSLTLVLNCLQDSSSLVIEVAIDCLSTIAQSATLRSVIQIHVYKAIVEKFLGSITDRVYFSDSRETGKNVDIARLLYGCLEWLLWIPADLINNYNFRSQVLDVIENIITDANIQITTAFSTLRVPSRKTSRIKKPPSQQFERQDSPLGSPRIESEEIPLTPSAVGEFDLESAENVLMHFLHFYRYFPTQAGPASLNTRVDEDVATDETSNNFRVILSQYDRSILIFEPSGNSIKVTVRNALGKFSWDLTCLDKVPDVKISSSNVHLGLKTSIEVPSTSTEDQALHEIRSLIELQDKLYLNPQEKGNDSALRSYVLKKDLLVGGESISSSITQLLYSLGLITSDLQIRSLHEGIPPSIQYLRNNSALWRDIRGLDKKYGRESVKLAVVYVGPGQEDEITILSNTYRSSSSDYRDFINSLGWSVDLKVHPGFLAGLERSGATGKKATYFSTSTLEMIFHDVTQMPNDDSDVKQVKKKRHIGNDQVHIVWNEHFRNYKPNTIAGDFGNVQIIITPLSLHSAVKTHEGFYAIEVRRRTNTVMFGPLTTSMVVPKYLLGSLVRATAIHAYRKSLNDEGVSYKRPYHYRLNDIKMIASRYRIDKPPNEKNTEMKKSPTSEEGNGFDLFLKQTETQL